MVESQIVITSNNSNHDTNMEVFAGLGELTMASIGERIYTVGIRMLSIIIEFDTF